MIMGGQRKRRKCKKRSETYCRKREMEKIKWKKLVEHFGVERAELLGLRGVKAGGEVDES